MVDFDPQRWRCPDCGEPGCWYEAVDQTNDAGIQTHLVLHKHGGCTCPHCGNEHRGAEPDQYCIPDTLAVEPAPLVPMVRCGFTVLETGEHFDTEDQAYARHEHLWCKQDKEHQAALRELGQDD